MPGLVVPSWAGMIDISIDIDSTRKSGSDITGTLTTQPGFISWDVTNVGTSGTTIVQQGVTFELFGLAAVNQSRWRATGDGGPNNGLTTDFVFNDGADRAVGLRITGLDEGFYDMQSWHFDSGVSVTGANEFNQVEVRNQGDAFNASQIVVDNFQFSGAPTAFVVPVTAPGQIKEIIFREDSTTNRARLNAFHIANSVPEPAALSLVTLLAFVFGPHSWRFRTKHAITAPPLIQTWGASERTKS